MRENIKELNRLLNILADDDHLNKIYYILIDKFKNEVRSKILKSEDKKAIKKLYK